MGWGPPANPPLGYVSWAPPPRREHPPPSPVPAPMETTGWAPQAPASAGGWGTRPVWDATPQKRVIFRHFYPFERTRRVTGADTRKASGGWGAGLPSSAPGPPSLGSRRCFTDPLAGSRLAGGSLEEERGGRGADPAPALPTAAPALSPCARASKRGVRYMYARHAGDGKK